LTPAAIRPQPGFQEVAIVVKNLRGKTVKRENAYEVWSSRDGSWKWYVLKHYQSTEAEAKNPYARVFCLVTSPIVGEDGELGDTYLSEIKANAYEAIRRDPATGAIVMERTLIPLGRQV
jgi:hypothetical protein